MTNLQALIAIEDAADAAREARRAVFANVGRVAAECAIDQNDRASYEANLHDTLTENHADATDTEIEICLTAFRAACDRAGLN
jgi:hypothetical protein